MDTELFQKFQAWFESGAKSAKPDIQIISQYISPAGDFSGFNDPARGLILAQGMFDGGADIVYHAAGGSGIGVFQAAAASGGRAIGVIPRDLFAAEHLHTGLSDVIATSGMHERKLRMTELASAFAVFALAWASAAALCSVARAAASISPSA